MYNVIRQRQQCVYRTAMQVNPEMAITTAMQYHIFWQNCDYFSSHYQVMPHKIDNQSTSHLLVLW